MSATAPFAPPASAARRPGWVRRNRVPLLAVAGPVLAKVALGLMERFEVGLEFLFPATMAFQFLALIALVVLAGWFFFAAGYSARTRAVVAAAVLLGVVAFVATVRKVEFDGQMDPVLRFRWQPADDQLLAEHLAAAAPAADAADLTAGPTDSPAFRGPAGDGVTPGVALSPDWAATPPKVLWRHPVGGGHAGVAVAGNSAVTLEQRGGDEAVVCYERATGRERWVYAYPARFATSEPMGGDGPRTTPAIAGGDVFALGAAGDLVCLAGPTGKPKWQVNVLADNGAKNIDWGQSGSPLVVGDLVVVNPGVDPKANAGKAVAAYDRATGKKAWAAGTHPAAYASPQVMTLDGKAAVVVFDADGLGGHDPATGAELWRHPWKTDMGMNSAQPVGLGGGLFVSSEKSNGGARVGFSPTPAEAWRTRGLSARFASPVLHHGHLYGLTDGRLTCVDAATGKRLWSEGSYGNGQVLRAGDLLVITAEAGGVHLAAADPAEYRDLGSAPVFAARTWNMPALAGNQLFVRNHREMACVELSTAK